MAEFSSCNWCGKVYRLKHGFITGLVQNRKYCSKKCKLEAEGQMRFSFLNHLYEMLGMYPKTKLGRRQVEIREKKLRSVLD
ncbi:MAG: hypothetical protein QM786_04810 [Breznakibacter sp.]